MAIWVRRVTGRDWVDVVMDDSDACLKAARTGNFGVREEGVQAEASLADNLGRRTAGGASRASMPESGRPGQEIAASDTVPPMVSPEDRAPDRNSSLRALPKVDRLLDSPALGELKQKWGAGVVSRHIRLVLQELRTEILATPGRAAPSPDEVVELLKRRIPRDAEALPRILNATGVVLHSGLGRAPLSSFALDAIVRAGGYSLLEVERNEGERELRDTRAGQLLRELTGAEDAFVVNNNAAATLLILAAVAAGREVICSRGELVEIGGSYRIPDVMAASGCHLVEVGTTNRTHLADYRRAMRSETAALLAVHTSNYRIVGFTAAPLLSELAALAQSGGIPLIHDLGSGSLLSPVELGIGDEPPVRASFSAGADIVCMSGDKLLGGPQAGIILGKKVWLDRMRAHPLARALRIDKLRIAALEATLALYLEPSRVRAFIPVLRMLSLSVEGLRPKAERLAASLHALALPGVHARVVETAAEAGSGALPALPIPSLGVDLETPAKPAALGRALRHQAPGVFTRTVENRVRFDVRTLFDGEESEIAPLVRSALADLER